VNAHHRLDTTDDPRHGPLAGVRVIEWAHAHMGPAGGMFLADMGADVVHVERPEGDMMRRTAGTWGVSHVLPHDRNAIFEDLSRNKRSVALDLRKPAGGRIMHELARQADVFLTNMRPAAIAKHQLDYETLARLNPRLIYCGATSFGERGPERDSPGLEMMGMARSGMLFGSSVRGQPPQHPTVGTSDRLGGIGIAMGIIAALFARERTGEGQAVYTSQLGWGINLQTVAVHIGANTGQNHRPVPRDDANDPLYNWYRCKDGTWTALGMIIYGEHFWPLVCEALGLAEIVRDERFATPQARETNRRELIALLDEAFAQITYPEWERAVREHDLIATRVNELTDLAADEQILANEYIKRQEHPVLGPWSWVTTPLRFTKTPVSIRSPAPDIGQHTDEVLREYLGTPRDELERLHADGVIGRAETRPAGVSQRPLS
jgi:crotonobetainyl-CoA:carnitine CoA-transferase CaiB-like acyl-CoA transferase